CVREGYYGTWFAYW
nr:immunoglobulin heavy chain junction region [Mus musculus]